MLGNPRVLELAGKVWKLKRNAATSWKIRKQQLRIKELRILQVYKDEGRKTLFIRTNSAEERTTTILKHNIPSLKTTNQHLLHHEQGSSQLSSFHCYRYLMCWICYFHT